MSQIINRKELLGLFMETHGSKILSVVYNSDSRVRKKNNPHPNVRKTVKVNAIANYKFSRALEKRLAQLGQNPVASKDIHSRNWGVHVPNTPLIEYNDKYYLDIMIGKVLSTRYVDTDTNKEVTYDDIKDFLPNRESSIVKVANISLENIESVKIMGTEYQVID